MTQFLILFHRSKSLSFRGVYGIDQCTQQVRIMTLLDICVLICSMIWFILYVYF